MNEAVARLAVSACGIVLSACGFPRPSAIVENDASVDATNIDAPATDVAGGDAPATQRCNPTASFGAPVALTSINTIAAETDPHLSPDELTIYFSSDRAGSGGFDIFQATRASIAAPFGTVVPVTGVNTVDDDRDPSVTGDGLSMFAFSQPGGSFRHITLATRTSTTLAFGALQVVATVNGSTNDSDPYILPAGNVLYFASDRTGNYALYRSAKSGGAFAAPTIVSGVDLDTADIESTPVVSPDELTLFFGSTRPGGAGTFDMYEATRASTADGFGAAIPLTSLNSMEFEVPSWISADGCELYFTHSPSGEQNQLYVATRGR
jgi:Tol biopolymer transport system component